MSIKNKKRLLLLWTVALWGIGYFLFEWSMQEVELPAAETKVRTPSIKLKKKSENVPSDVPVRFVARQFEPYWEKPLQQPLYDPPPPKPKVVEKPPPKPIQATILATMIEPNNTMAMIQLSGNKVVFRKIGEVIGPQNPEAIIADIQDGFVIVKQEEQEVRLTIPGK